jgi:hypothetical protein
LLAWALDELTPWRLYPSVRSVTEAAMHDINRTSATIYLYEFRAGTVRLLEKPAGIEEVAVRRDRARAYLGFFQSLCHLLPADYDATIPLAPGDKLVERVEIPVFTFQKRRGARQVLLPDIDFLHNHFYERPAYEDATAYKQKSATAIFVGSTSGGMITAQIARDCTIPRLRAARFFQGNRRVAFLLPNIVQTRSEEAREILQEYAFCRPTTLWWQQQFNSRFLISMDGNGATCSRVAVALKSNSVLMKYDSEDVLFYFRALQPWLHFVPVSNDSDIDRILDLEAESPDQFEGIAHDGRTFAETYLTREALGVYMVNLLLLYRNCFHDGVSPSAGAVVSEAQTPAMDFFPLAGHAVLSGHVQGRGDIVADAFGWLGEKDGPRAVEGFLLSFTDPSINKLFTVRAVRGDGSLGERLAGGSYCGTKRQNLSLYGFAIDEATESEPPPILYEGVFRGGFRSGLLLPGSVCKSPTGDPLVAIRFVLTEAIAGSSASQASLLQGKVSA